MPTLVSLTSAQTLPNVLFIKEMGVFDHYLFLSTDRMEEEGRTDWVIRAAGLPKEKCEIILINAEDANASLNLLAEEQLAEEETYVINLTGGTKMMALATYAFFTGFPNSQIYYSPIGSGKTLRVFPEPGERPIDARVSLQEYLDAYGVKVLRKENPTQAEINIAGRVFNHFVGKKKLPAIQDKLQLGAKLENKAEKRFYTGGWLEVWLYQKVRSFYHLSDKEIGQGILLNKSGLKSEISNEYDLFFVKDNRLFVGECKAFLNKFNKTKINTELYKLGTLSKQMGLNARPFFVIAFNPPGDQTAKSIAEQCRLLGIAPPAYLDTLVRPSSLKAFLDNV